MNLCVVPERERGSSRGNLAPSEAIRASSRTCLPIEDGGRVSCLLKNTVAARDGLTLPANIAFSCLLGPNQMRETTNIWFLTSCFSCTAMYVGEYCQHLNPCHTGPGPRCQNGGSCHVRASTTSSPSFWCTCPIGYSASLCEIPVANSCDSDPCLNGGTCALISLDKYTCTCSPGYTGKDYHPHSGHDINSVPQYRCIGCAARTQARAVQSTSEVGQHCELQDHCASNPCRNGADCTSSGNSYKCKCSPGFIGPTCSEDIVECRSAPCVHGRCFNTHGSYKMTDMLEARNATGTAVPLE
uniref:EGF-like domain-containing protein n=1 Tax=Timema douglasi TaxID=61478 RepID=A0A7R8VX05_TIMDO|nr:unnamed protein product [Timema douglasi]